MGLVSPTRPRVIYGTQGQDPGAYRINKPQENSPCRASNVELGREHGINCPYTLVSPEITYGHLIKGKSLAVVPGDVWPQFIMPLGVGDLFLPERSFRSGRPQGGDQ